MSSSIQAEVTKGQSTFSLRISPDSLTCIFKEPLTGLLHSTKGSCRNVFKTLDKKIQIIRLVIILTCMTS